MRRCDGTLILCLWLSMSCVAAEKPFDAAAAFGARPSVSDVSLSPDGASIAFISPLKGSGSALYTLSLKEGAKIQLAMLANGNPVRLRACEWISNTRLTCTVYAVVDNKAIGELLPVTRLLAVDSDGGNQKLLSTQSNAYTRGFLLGGGEVIDVLPEQDGSVLMTRQYLPDDHAGTLIGSTRNGLGVDRIDTRTLAVTNVEPPHPDAFEYLTDGHGAVRIMGLAMRNDARGQNTGTLQFMYRATASSDWQKLCEYTVDGSGFRPLAVDSTHNVVYGLEKADGRKAIYSMALDGTLHQELVYQRPDVDVAGLLRIGRQQRVVGVHYNEEKGYVHYFDSAIEQMHTALGKALPTMPSLTIVDSSTDESKLLVFAYSGSNPGMYYLFDRKTHQLRILLAVRDQLVDVPLATMEPIQYPAADGTQIPGYLTLPVGEPDPKGRPAIVLPHGGPAARDNWQFNWLAQFFAARGFVVLQPNFRGSSGYGDAWFEQNGFKSWRIAIGDVLDAGRWLVARGIADPGKLAVVGWSYGGYAALQSAVVDPKLFKAVVAIAPVTDLAALKEEHRNWTDFELVSRYVGEGSHLREGSPIENAADIKVPVLLFHGGHDRNVGIGESKRMAARLTATGGHSELITWDDLDHQLEDSEARARMLRRSDEFLRQALGM